MWVLAIPVFLITANVSWMINEERLYNYGFDNTEYPAHNEATKQDFLAKVTCPVEVVNYPVKIIESSEIELDLKYDFNFLYIDPLESVI